MAERVTFTRSSAQRISNAVRTVEQGGRDAVGYVPSPRMVGGGGRVRLGKTTSEWVKGTLATIELYEEGTPGSEAKKSPDAAVLESCVNKFAAVDENKWVIVAKAGNGSWYLIAAECTEEEA